MERGSQQRSTLSKTAIKLLRGCFYNPRHLPLIEAIDPPMPDSETKGLWSALKSAHDGEGHVDTAHFERRTPHGDPVSNVDESSSEYLRITQHASDPGQLEAWAVTLQEALAKQALYEDLKEITGKVRGNIEDRDAKLGDVISYVTNAVIEHSGGTSVSDEKDFHHMSDVVEEALGHVDSYEEGEGDDVMRTGIPSFDEATGGLDVSEKSVIAGLSGSGKSTLAMEIIKRQARRVVGDDEVIAVFSPEMKPSRFAMRGALGDLNRQIPDRENVVTEQRLRSGELTSEQYDAYRDYLKRMKDLNVWFCPNPRPDKSEMRSALYQLKARYNVAQVFVDYDEYIEQDGRNIEERVSRASAATTELASEIGCGWIDLSQYKTAAEERNDVPRDSDLRGSRQKWHDSALIGHIYWPHHWVRKGREPNEDYLGKDRFWIVVSKNRGGDVCKVPMRYYPEEYRFADPNASAESDERVRPEGSTEDEAPF